MPQIKYGRKCAEIVYGESTIARRIFLEIGQAPSIFFKIGAHHIYTKVIILAEEIPPGIDV